MQNKITAHAVNNRCYKAAQKMVPRGIIVHSTGANNPYLRRYVDAPAEAGENPYGNHWNVPRPGGQDVCVHAFIGRDKNGTVRVAEILPLDVCAWGVGRGAKGSYNFDPPHVQFEICEDALADEGYFREAFAVAAAYCAELCRKFDLAVDTIVSHREAHLCGYGSNHGDPEHWMARFGMTMDDFRADIARRLTGDVNGDGTVDARDATALLRYLSGWDVPADTGAADLDGDGTVTTRDATLLLRRLAGWENVATARPVLTRGAAGDEVKLLQTLLISAGYSVGDSGADGSFGPATDAAVRKFQREHDLAVDGSVGPLTWGALLG